MTAEHLARAKQLVQSKDPIATAALQQLVRDADAVVTQGPYSVMDKTLTPPSGDKHDFYSIGPYWWPNPDVPGGLPYVRRDGQVNPERNSNATDAASLDAMARNTITLLLAQYFTDDARYGDRAVRFLRAWFINPATRMNPHLRYGQAIPGISEGRGIGIIDTEEFVDLVRLLMVIPAPQWTVSDAEALRSWFNDYLEWLLTSDLGFAERREHNNHGTWYDAQVTWFSLYCGRTIAAKEMVRGVMRARIEKHIEPDGKQPHELARTRPMSYTCFNLSGLMHLADAGALLGIDLWRASTPDGKSILRAAEWLIPYTEKTWDTQLDPPEVRYTAILRLLRRAALVTGDDRFEEAIGKLPSAEWWPLRFNLLWPRAQ